MVAHPARHLGAGPAERGFQITMRPGRVSPGFETRVNPRPAPLSLRDLTPSQVYPPVNYSPITTLLNAREVTAMPEEESTKPMPVEISGHYPRWLAAQLVEAAKEPDSESRISAISRVIARARVIAPALFRAE